jgi:hypothetical protein
MMMLHLLENGSKILTMLSRVPATNFGHDVVFILTRDHENVLGAVAMDRGSQVEGDQVDPILTDAFVFLPDPYTAHPLLPK